MEDELKSHIERLEIIVDEFARFLNMGDEKRHKLIKGAKLHDIGKVYIDNKILYKKGRLEEEELKEIKKHPLFSYAACVETEYNRDILDMALLHHERADGKGYPYGYMGNKIPPLVKVLSLCDSYEAMTGNRSYRKPLTTSSAIIEINNNLGTQFDETIGRGFIKFLKESYE